MRPLLLVGALLATGALGVPASHARLRVAASTTFIAETVAIIGGDAVDVTAIFPRDADPHAYEPSPRELARLEGVQAVFLNGFDLEESLRGPLKHLSAPQVDVSAGVPPRRLDGHESHDRHAHEGHACDHDVDPHVWTDPVAMQAWTTNIAAALAGLDPANAEGYRARAAGWNAELRALDAWIREQVARIPGDRRVIVTDHNDLGWFAGRYGFRIVGAVFPGFSTQAEPSARELAVLEKTIRAAKVPAIFSSGIVAPTLAQRVAADTGTRLVALPGCSLGRAGTGTATLAGWLKVTTERIVGALAPP